MAMVLEKQELDFLHMHNKTYYENNKNLLSN